ncbi:Heterokaryon incompatibility domain-containing protein [Phytophthora infestans]|uniref:Heterokaryon incompatibility domain-containing protein n=1 Tax=Phytophthora infestans TaxID=4787 RepID=A0A833SLL4_PHYIN|nr:Heterokaryon incompatibility domain-containing protein [Phytophthora infestans]
MYKSNSPAFVFPNLPRLTRSLAVLVFKLSESPANGITSSCGSFVLQRRQFESTENLSEVTAISYAWGSLPHSDTTTWFDGDFNETIRLKFGKEWDPTKFLKELVVLSHQTWLWIDQICLHQCNATTKELCISIPAIYQNATILVLLPGSDCEIRDRVIDTKKLANLAIDRVLPIEEVAVEQLMLRSRPQRPSLCPTSSR